MWQSNELGLAVWRADGAAWCLDARGGEHGVGVIRAAGEDSLEQVAKTFLLTKRFFRLTPVGQDQLPAAGEQFIRGAEYHVDYPQGDGTYSLRIAFRPVSADANRLVLETRISIQTDLLDTHPKLDIDAWCQALRSLTPDEGFESGSAPISLACGDEYTTAVLLGPHDRPFTTNHSTDSLVRLRLFGEFLEKGVIRKARPWIMIDRSGSEPSESDLQSCYQELCSSPLPLTA